MIRCQSSFVPISVSAAAFAVCFLIFQPCFSQPADPLTDSRNGKTYKTVIIGTQTWMAENLNYQTPDSWCYENNPDYCSQYGRLYTWEAANNVCLVGWHTPNEEEWATLELYLGMPENEVNAFLYRGEGVGAKLKSESGWQSEDGKNYGSNESGFNALPGGIRVFYDGSFIRIGTQGYWWSSSLDGQYGWRRSIFSDKTGIDRDLATCANAYSVRCVKD